MIELSFSLLVGLALTERSLGEGHIYFLNPIKGLQRPFFWKDENEGVVVDQRLTFFCVPRNRCHRPTR
jgi:hypothetical protein